MDNTVFLWQLISDWLNEAKLGWKVGRRGETNLVEKIDDPDSHYYIGDDYVAAYPSCRRHGDRIIAADPEFFKKLEEFLVHTSECYWCTASKEITKEIDKIMMDNIMKSIAETSKTVMDIKLANAYAPPPMRYPTINVNTDP